MQHRSARTRALRDGFNAGFINRETGATRGDGDIIELQRVWTSDAAAYPVGGRKHKKMTPWTRQLLLDAEIFIGEGDLALQKAFDDDALLASLKLHAIVNVPLLDERGGCFATFNLSTSRSHWLPSEVLLIRLLAALVTPIILQASKQFLESKSGLNLTLKGP